MMKKTLITALAVVGATMGTQAIAWNDYYFPARNIPNEKTCDLAPCVCDPLLMCEDFFEPAYKIEKTGFDFENFRLEAKFYHFELGYLGDYSMSPLFNSELSEATVVFGPNGTEYTLGQVTEIVGMLQNFNPDQISKRPIKKIDQAPGFRSFFEG